MKIETSAFLLEKKVALKRIVEELTKEFDYVSVLGTDVVGNNYTVRTGLVSIAPSSDTDRGFVIRVFHDGLVTEYSFNELKEAEVLQAVRKAALEDRTGNDQRIGLLRYAKLPKDEPLIKEYIAEVSSQPKDDRPDEIIHRLQQLHDKAYGVYPEVVQLGVGCSITTVHKLFLSKNRDLYQSYVYSTASAFAYAAAEEGGKVDYKGYSMTDGSAILDQLQDSLLEVSKNAVELLSSKPVEPGYYDIICDPDFTGLIAHEAFGHGAEMDMFVKERAKGKDFMNKPVGSAILNMRDGALSISEVSSYLFDDEGNLGSDTKVIENGILRSGMADELASLQLGVQPTGNGKRESYKRKSYTRMTNTFFDEGEDTLEDMIASIEHGYLLEGMESGMEDPKNWGIQCVAAKGREIKNGKLTGKVVSPVVLTGYVPDLLQSISMVSKGIKMSGGGYCGKGHKEWVKTSTGGSYIKAKGLLS